MWVPWLGRPTKCSTAFSDEHIEFLLRSLAALSTVIRLHTDDLVMKTLTGRLEEEVEVAQRASDLEAVNKNLEAANTRVVKQSAAQLKYSAMNSHEIRTPLNCVIGISSLLEESGLDTSQRDSVRMIVLGGDLLAKVVNDVLDTRGWRRVTLTFLYAPPAYAI
jgi:signal transduction histidine kinase